MAEPVDPVEPLWMLAARAAEARAAPMPLPEFWRHVAALGWSVARHTPEPCGALLAERLTVAQVAAMRLRLRLLESELAARIEQWTLRDEESLDLPVDLQAALREHLVGLGEAAYTAALKGPWRAKHCADRDDYLEGFGRCFDAAYARFPASALEQALADLAP